MQIKRLLALFVTVVALIGTLNPAAKTYPVFAQENTDAQLSPTPSPSDTSTEREIIPTDPGIEMTPFSKEDGEKAAEGDANILSIIGHAFARPWIEIAKIGACQNEDGSCVEIDDIGQFTSMQEYIYGQGGGNPTGGALLPWGHYQQLEWPDQGDNNEESDLRYQYPGCYKATTNPAVEKASQIVERIVNSFMAITSDRQTIQERALASLRISAAMTNAYIPLSNMKLATPNKNSKMYDMVNGKPQLKEEYKKYFEACEKDSGGKQVAQRPEPVTGAIEGGNQISIGATADQAIKFASDFRGGLQFCLSSISNAFYCLNKVVPVKPEGGTWSIKPGAPVQAAFAGGKISDSELPETVGSDAKALIGEVRPGGAIGSRLPTTHTDNLPVYAGAEGTVNSKISISNGANDEPVAETSDLSYSGAYGFQRRFDFQKCSDSPVALRSNLGITASQCEPEPPASIYAYTDFADDVPLPNISGDFEEQLVQISEALGIPVCVMEGVARIERRPNVADEPDLAKCLASVNTCSAAGPMQFTTGRGPASDPNCRTCAAGFCPNAWASYGNGGNPCVTKDALAAAARMLKRRGGLTTAPPETQKEAIHKAATAYYGSDNNALARNRLNGCEYWEFVYKQCVPSFRCAQQRN